MIEDTTCSQRLEAYFRANRVPYQVQFHRWADSAKEVAAVEHVPEKNLAKVVMVVADGELTMVVVPATHRLDLPFVAAALGDDYVRLAREEEFAATFPDCAVGAMPPFGNLYGVPVWVDATLTADETIVFQAGSHTETMTIAYADFERLVHPRVATFAHRAYW